MWWGDKKDKNNSWRTKKIKIINMSIMMKPRKK
jgi:hypothetical protein